MERASAYLPLIVKFMVDWDSEQIQEIIEELLSAERDSYIEFLDEFVLFKYPSRDDFSRALLEEKKALKQAERDKFPTIVEMTNLLYARGLWTDELQEKSDGLREKIKGLVVVKDNPNLTKTEKRKNILEESIKTYENELYELENVKEVKLAQTAERKSKEAKLDYLCWVSTYNAYTREKFWSSFDSFIINCSLELKSEVLTNFLDFLGGHTQHEIRYIARSNLWRINYLVASKANIPVFDRPLKDLNGDQTQIIYWSQFYQNIYEMLPEDQPDEETIDDDEALDKWLEEYHKERNEERDKARHSNRFTSSAMNKDEVIVFKSNPNYDKIEYSTPPTVKAGQANINTTKESDKRRGARLQRMQRRLKREKLQKQNK